MNENNEQKVIHHGFTDEQLREAGEAMKLQSENTALKLEVERNKEAFREIYTWLLNNKHNGLESEIGLICKKQLYGED